MFGPTALTHVVYVLLVVVFVGIISYMVIYNLRQKAKLKEVERGGRHPISVDEGIVLAQEQAKLDHDKKQGHHS